MLFEHNVKLLLKHFTTNYFQMSVPHNILPHLAAFFNARLIHDFRFLRKIR